MPEYRNGNDKENHVRKVPGMHKVADVTLKRGIIGSTDSLRVDQRDPHHRPGDAAERHHHAADDEARAIRCCAGT